MQHVEASGLVGVCDSIGLSFDGNAEAHESVPKLGVCLVDIVEVDSSSSNKPIGDFGMEET